MRSLTSYATLLAFATLAGCSAGNSGTSPVVPGSTLQSQAAAPQTIAFSEAGLADSSFAATTGIGVRLNGETPSIDKRYGKILGYAKGTTTKVSHVVTIVRGQSVVFHNVDAGDPHTASFLGDATKNSAPWPTSFNGSSTQSKAGTDISSPSFSTGAMSPGTSSLKYVANVPGFYMFGCAFHYNAFGMRDVIIVR